MKDKIRHLGRRYLPENVRKRLNYRLVIVELHAWAIGETDVKSCRDILTAAGLEFQQRAGITEAWARP